MLRTRRTKIRLEMLEDRTVPTIWGIPWTNSSHLTISFVPDGTQVDGQSSNLFQKMSSSGLSQSTWQSQVLQAFQAWSNVTNVDFDVVPDSGAPLGTPGATQGDSRFGDIRIASVPMTNTVLALTSPPAPGPLTGTRAGDIVLNANDKLSVGGGGLLGGLSSLLGNTSVDLYTLVQHEIGHSLGLPNNTNTASVMYQSYQGAKTGLGSADTAAIQALYGTPPLDFFKQAGATSLSTAWSVQAPPGTPSGATLGVAGDLTSVGDANFFQFATGSSNPNGLTVTFETSVESLLAGQITLYGPNQKVLATATATGPSQDLTLHLASVTNNTTYYIKVNPASGTPYSMGAYQLTVVSNPAAPMVSAKGSNGTLQNTGTNSDFSTAVRLQTSAGYASGSHYTVNAVDQNPGQSDYYSVQAPAAATVAFNTMAMTITVPNGGALPTVTVYNSNQQPVSLQWVSNSSGCISFQVANPTPGATYYVALQNNSSVAGASSYRLDVAVFSENITLQVDTLASLSAAKKTVTGTITESQGEQREFFLVNLGSTPGTWVQMTIYDSQGQAVFTTTAYAGQTSGGITLLNAGTYTVSITEGSSTGDLPPVDFDLFSANVSGTVGATPANPNLFALGSGNTTTSQGSGSSSGGSGYVYNGTQKPNSGPS